VSTPRGPVVNGPSSRRRATARLGCADVAARLCTSLADLLRRAAGSALRWGWDSGSQLAAIGPREAARRGFAAFGDASAICFPTATLFGEPWIRIGTGTLVGPYASLSVGVWPDAPPPSEATLVIGDRCVLGRAVTLLAHEDVRIGDDVWMGPGVFVSDANHGYEELSEPIGRQFASPRAVSVGNGSWLGAGVIVLGGAVIGEHVVVGAGSVVTGVLPDRCVAVGNPARVVRRHTATRGWIRDGEPADGFE